MTASLKNVTRRADMSPFHKSDGVSHPDFSGLAAAFWSYQIVSIVGCEAHVVLWCLDLPLSLWGPDSIGRWN